VFPSNTSEAKVLLDALDKAINHTHRFRGELRITMTCTLCQGFGSITTAWDYEDDRNGEYDTDECWRCLGKGVQVLDG
jgi:hypothetical protein